jgi:hypothetical protein
MPSIGLPTPAATRTGMEIPSFTPFKASVPLPSWPLAFQPQHIASPVFNTAQAWPLPATIAVTGLPSPVTLTGDGLEMFEPLPSSP